MTGMAVGFVAQNDRLPARGDRIATWLEGYLRLHPQLTAGELAFRVRADKRDVRRLLAERSCGSRLEDALAAYFGWDFVEAVMTPVVGADPITARERDLDARQAQVAALHARLERDRAARAGVAALTDRAGIVPALHVGGEGGGKGQGSATGVRS